MKISFKKIQTWINNPILRSVSDEVEEITEELIEFCKQHLARFKVPKDVVITEIPKTSTGKLQKFVLRDWAKERAVGEFN